MLTLFPEMFPGPLAHSLAGKALADGLWALDAVNIRDFATDRHSTVDDTPFGGGPGMVMRADVVDAAADGGSGRDSRSRAECPCLAPNLRRALFRHARGRETSLLLVLRSFAVRQDQKLRKSGFSEHGMVSVRSV